jgi:hypothetical protein
MPRSFERTLQAHRLDHARVWLAVLGGSCLMALAWTWWAVREHSDTVTAKTPAPRGGAGR